MQPATLFVVLRFLEHVLRCELIKQDRRELLTNLEELHAHFPDMAELLDSTTNQLPVLCKSATHGDRQLLSRFVLEYTNNVRAIMAAADRDALTPVLQRVADLVPGFGPAFLEQLQKMKLSHARVCQAAASREVFTRLHNYNLHKVPARTQDNAISNAAAAGAAAAAAPAAASSSAFNGSSIGALDTDVRFHYRYSTDRVGCHCHYLPTYLSEHVNYLSDEQFFQSDETLRQQSEEFFVSDVHFNRDILAPRGYGGVLVFKVDLSFERRKQGMGGTDKFFKRATIKAARAAAKRKPTVVPVDVSEETDSDDEVDSEPASDLHPPEPVRTDASAAAAEPMEIDDERV
jgi:hypothetical protein